MGFGLDFPASFLHVFCFHYLDDAFSDIDINLFTKS